MEYLLGYLVFSCVLFILDFCEDVAHSGSYSHVATYRDNDFSFWGYSKEFFGNGWVIFVHALCKLHCPWSWKTAREHRVQLLRNKLRDHCTHHEVLGHINTADCDDPTNHQAIARYCFVSRKRFWGTRLLWLLGTGAVKCIAAVLLALLGIVYLLRGGWYVLREKFGTKQAIPRFDYRSFLLEERQRQKAGIQIPREKLLSDNRVH